MEIANAEGEHAGPHNAALCCQVFPPGLHQLQPSALGRNLLPFLRVHGAHKQSWGHNKHC